MRSELSAAEDSHEEGSTEFISEVPVPVQVEETEAPSSFVSEVTEIVLTLDERYVFKSRSSREFVLVTR